MFFEFIKKKCLRDDILMKFLERIYVCQTHQVEVFEKKTHIIRSSLLFVFQDAFSLFQQFFLAKQFIVLHKDLEKASLFVLNLHVMFYLMLLRSINSSIDSCNVMYLITCSNYREQYAGSATNFKQRFRIHKSDIKPDKDICGIARHFNNKYCSPHNKHVYLKYRLLNRY